MVARDGQVQIAVVAVTIGLATLWVPFAPSNPVLSGAFVVTTYVLLFAGSHAYLAARGDGESVPVGARWRFVALVSFSVVALLVGNSYGGVELGGHPLPTLVWALVAVVFAGYVAYEARDAYRETRRS